MLAILGSVIPFAYPAALLGLTGFYLDYADQKRAKAADVFRGYDNAMKALGLALWELLWMFIWVVIPALILTAIGTISVGRGFVNGMAFAGRGIPVFAKIMLYLAVLWVFLCSIYKRVQYSFAFFVLAAHPELSVGECLRRSRDLTADNFWQLLVMRLSFIGWAILSVITCGLVGYFWANPYFNFTYAMAYRQLDPTITAGGGGGGGIVNPPANPRLHGMAGLYAGTDFNFSPGEVLTLGRDDAVCNIIFPESEDKISRVHCRISFDSSTNAYTVMDESSNGTLLADGTRLKQRMATALPRGSVILLGDSKNSFRLE
jgi:uncharacterized membrane protein